MLNAAALLDVTEFELFRLAHLHWHGREAEPRVAERTFAAYMFADLVPVWAHHFARRVEGLAGAGRLDREALGVARVAGSREMVARGVRFAIIVSAAVISLIVLAEITARLLAISARCLFPPCY